MASREMEEAAQSASGEMPIFSEDSYYNAGYGDQLHSPKNITEGTITAIANERTASARTTDDVVAKINQPVALLDSCLLIRLIRRPSLRARTLASAFPR